MKTFFFIFLTVQILTLFLNARIGEERLALERRLLKSGGYQYRDEKVIENRRKGMPYIKFEEFFPISRLTNLLQDNRWKKTIIKRY